ncbi:MAG: pilus assembly protein [Rhodospirillales bacterium]|nr:pilus assembly protein [Rhodospirillales bacterium]
MRLDRSSVRRHLGRASLRRDCAGLAAVEFALVLPIMLLLYFGIVEFTQAITVDRLVGLTAETVTNLVTQYTTISASTQMPDILDASKQVLAPYSSASATVVVSCITVDSNGNATVAWSQALNGTARTAGQPFTLPAAFDIPSTSVIFGEVTYPFTPLFDYLNLGSIDLYASVYMVPRDATTINLAP